MIKCPLCDREWGDWKYNEAIMFRHICEKHLGFFQFRPLASKIMCRCWCGLVFEGDIRLGNQDHATGYAPMWQHWADEGGLLAHFLACQLENE